MNGRGDSGEGERQERERGRARARERRREGARAREREREREKASEREREGERLTRHHEHRHDEATGNPTSNFGPTCCHGTSAPHHTLTCLLFHTAAVYRPYSSSCNARVSHKSGCIRHHYAVHAALLHALALLHTVLLLATALLDDYLRQHYHMTTCVSITT